MYLLKFCCRVKYCKFLHKRIISSATKQTFKTFYFIFKLKKVKYEVKDRYCVFLNKIKYSKKLRMLKFSLSVQPFTDIGSLAS